MENKIVHISTGGTIEGKVPEYKEVEYSSEIFSDIMDMSKYIVKSFKVKADYELVRICSKDSRDITDNDRREITNNIVSAYSRGVKNFLITHGTYTMPETGAFIMDNLPEETLENCNIVITGAMYPINLVGSDGLMNLGAAISSLLNSENLGVKISMHGVNWNPKEVRKDAANLIFTPKN